MAARNRSIAGVAASLSLMTLPGAAAPPLPADFEIIDLTHTLDANFPFIPVPGVTFPFGLTPIATLEANGVAANRWQIHEHLGTQIDAPNHFARGGVGLDALDAADLLAPMAVIDFRQRAAGDADAVLTVDDVRRWEDRHGRIPDGAAVILYTGWDARVKDANAYINADANHTKHFPGFGVEAVNWLIGQRNIRGVGVDTLSFDPGNDNEYRTHKAVLGAGRWAVEAVANLQAVPPLGATLFVGAPKVRDATGGPVRLIALRPKSPRVDIRQLHGVWKDAAPQRIERADGTSTYVDREFTFTDDTWQIVFTVSKDAQGAAKLFEGTFGGPYSIDEHVPLVAAYRARFMFSQRFVAAHDPALIAALNAARCGNGEWTSASSKEVSQGGCALLRIAPQASCPGEYDLIGVSGNELRLGARPIDGNLCTEERRPQWLGSALVRKHADH